MPALSRFRKIWIILPMRFVAYGLLAGVLCLTGPARAEETDSPGAGSVGGALLGAELAVLTPALLGVKPSWAYVAFAIVGATAGGIVGSRIEPRTEPEVSKGMLGAGVVLFIPSIVWFGNLMDARAAQAPRLDPWQGTR
jgi:hypothetical protein